MQTDASLLPQLPLAFRRLASLAKLDAADLMSLEIAARASHTKDARRDLSLAVAAAPGLAMILDGWAFRACLLPNGRRQITDLFLPGDVIFDPPIGRGSPYSLNTITRVTWCTIATDTLEVGKGLHEALLAAQRLENQSLRRQAVRLGRLDAVSRLADWLLALHARLTAAGLCVGNTMPLPLTQELIADALGLTTVHVNRTLSALRRQGLIEVQGGRATILNAARCLAINGHG